MVEESESEQKSELPRPGSTIYKFTQVDEEIQKKTLKKWKRLNKYLTIPLYRIGLLPALGFGRIFLILKTKGRVTGKTRRTPLEYHRINEIIHIFSGRGENADWVKNIRVNSDNVGVRHGFHWFHAIPEFVESPSEKKEIFQWYVTRHKRSAKMLFGWDTKKDDPKTADFSILIDLMLIIRLYRSSQLNKINIT